MHLCVKALPHQGACGQQLISAKTFKALVSVTSGYCLHWLFSHSNKHRLILEIIFLSVASLALKLQTKRLSFQHFSHCQSSYIGYRRKVSLGQVWRGRGLIKMCGAGLEEQTFWKERRGELANIDSCSTLSLGTEDSNLRSLFLYCLETVLPICPQFTAEAELHRR